MQTYVACDCGAENPIDTDTHLSLACQYFMRLPDDSELNSSSLPPRPSTSLPKPSQVMALQDQQNEFSGSLNSFGAPIVAGAQLSTAGGSIYIGLVTL